MEARVAALTVPAGGEEPTEPGNASEEHTELIHKVSRMQAERAEQNEVVKHLQSRVRAMGSDLQLKSELISRNLSQFLATSYSR